MTCMPIPDSSDRAELREHIRLGLLTGGIRADAAALPIPLPQWRSLAKQIGRELGRRVHTRGTEQSAWAYFADWGRTEEERAISRDKLQQAIQATVAPALQAGEPGDGHDTTGLTD